MGCPGVPTLRRRAETVSPVNALRGNVSAPAKFKQPIELALNTVTEPFRYVNVVVRALGWPTYRQQAAVRMTARIWFINTVRCHVTELYRPVPQPHASNNQCQKDVAMLFEGARRQ